ncbi:MAG: hypothetical protein WC322_01890 [Candidatus Paceibacterota bacterium]|jgi:hypothetical protein
MNNFEQIISDLMVYLNPDCLKEEFKQEIIARKINAEKADEYYKILTSINMAYKKLLRYESYFTDFYPAQGKITKQEALEHHIHAYLEDVTILKNKITVFLGTLKNDLKKIAKNKEDIEKAMSWLIDQTQEVFKGVSDVRNPHHHQGMKFIDCDLIDSQIAEVLLGENSPLKSSFKPTFVEELKTKEEVSFVKARERWIATAQKNNKQITGFLDDIFGRNKKFIYDLLNMEAIVNKIKNYGESAK